MEDPRVERARISDPGRLRRGERNQEVRRLLPRRADWNLDGEPLVRTRGSHEDEKTVTARIRDRVGPRDWSRHHCANAGGRSTGARGAGAATGRRPGAA